MRLGRTRKAVIIICAVLMGGILLLFSTSRSARTEVVWGSSTPPVSERAYYVYRIHGIIESWMQNHADRRQITFDRSEPVTLVIDTEQKRIGKQEGSYAVTGGDSDLAAGLTWTLYHITPEGDQTYSGRMRLTLPAPSFRPKPIGDLYLVGQGDEGYMNFHLSTDSIESSYQTGMFQLSTIARDEAAEGESSSGEADEAVSLVVQQEESPTDSIGTTSETTALAEHRSQWNQAEALLYKKIEEALANRGYTLSGMGVVSGPDGTAGYAHVSFTTDQRRWYHWFTRFFSVDRSADSVSLLCDRVGEGLWYVCSAPESMLTPSPSTRSMPIGRPPEAEFLVEIGETSQSYDEREALALGRAGVAEAVSSTIPASPWKKELSNGIEIEIVGLCAFPNLEGAWWGPDGSVLETSPGFLIPPQRQRQFQQNSSGMYLNSAGFTMRRQSVAGIAMVCRIHLPPGDISIRRKLDSSAFSFRLSKTSQTLSGSGPIVNQYGISVDRDDYRTIIFDSGQDPIHYGFGIRSGVGNVPNYGFAWIAFRNVAGGLGRITDFQLTEVTGQATD